MYSTVENMQSAARVLRWISRVISIVSVTLASGCMLGLSCIAAGVPDLIGRNGCRIVQSVSLPSLAAGMMEGVFVFAGYALLARLAERYFDNEIYDGTPFTFAGAKELRSLGIFCILIPLCTTGIAKGFGGMLRSVLPAASIAWPLLPFVKTGVLLLMLSGIFRYGAECGLKPLPMEKSL